MILTNLQSELKAPKNNFNNFGKYNYRSCEDILEALKPLLKKYNSALLLNDEICEIGERVYVKSTAILKTDNGETYEASAYAREAEIKKGMDESQITGSASSYARKYALNGLFAIDDNKDADSLNTSGNYTEHYINANQIKELETIINKLGEKINLTSFYKFINVKTLKDIKASDFEKIKSLLNKKLQGAE